ncbi:hypothetical protein JCM17823_28020 [Halorubrum gandharaense]
MFDALADAALATLLRYGLPALFGLFVVKGAIVGKPVPTTVALPGFLLATGADRAATLVAVLVASVGYTVGQLVVFRLSARYGLDAVESLPYVTVSDAELARADRLFTRYAGGAIVVTNFVPYVGSFVMIPAGISAYPFSRAAVYAFVSTVANYVLIVAVVVWSVDFFFV